MGLTLILLIGAVSIAFLFLHRRMNYWKYRGIPYLQPSYLLGNIDCVGQKINAMINIQYVYELFKNESKLCGFYLLQSPWLLITDLELVKNILTKDFDSFTDRGMFHSEDDPLSNHLFALEGEKWKNLRHKLTTTFSSGKMRMMYPILQNFSYGLVDLVESLSSRECGIDLKNVLMRFTADVIGSCGFGLECNALSNENTEMMEMRKFFDIEDPKQRFNTFFCGAYMDVAKKLKMKITPDFVSNFFLPMIKETYDYRIKNDVNRTDFLSLLIQIKNYGKLKDEEMESVGTLTFDELAAQAFMFFVAGFETSSTSMFLALYELAYRPEIQNRLRDEIEDVVKRHDGKISYDSLIEMTYLDQVVNETLRLYSPMTQLFRIATADYKVPGMDFTIEKGTNLMIPIYSIHRDSRYYYDPEHFDPERFTPEEVKKRPAFAFIPFGSGRRNCIGERFGLMQTKLGIATVIKNFKISLHENTRYPFIMDFKSIIVSSFKPIYINAEKIQKK